MDEFDTLLQFWRILNDCRVKYIMVGSFATRLHGIRWVTPDLEMWLNNTAENGENLAKACKALGYEDFSSVEKMLFVPDRANFHLGGDLVLDIIPSVQGLENIPFDECLDLASIANLDGVEVPFLHINHLIKNKKANLPKEENYLIALEKIRKIRENDMEK